MVHDNGTEQEHCGVQDDDGGELGALRTVMLYVLSDAFALLPEEIMWAGFHLDEILSPLAGQEPGSVALAVRHESRTGEYSARLSRAESLPVTTAPAQVGPSAHVSAADWAAVLMHMVSTGYVLRPLVESSMLGQIIGLLRELGVGDGTAPRPAKYLPNDLREYLGR